MRGVSASTLKWIAVGSMVVDHAGYVFAHDPALTVLIGRLAFPLFAFLLVIGLEHTKNSWAYLGRLLTFAAISFVPHVLFYHAVGLNQYVLNIFFTLALALATLMALRACHSRFAQASVVAVCALGAEVGMFEYGAYGILIVVSFMLMRRLRVFGAVSFVLLSASYIVREVLLRIPGAIQVGAIFALPLLLAYNEQKGRDMVPRSFFYWFYPIHLLALSLFAFYLGDVDALPQ